MYNYSIDNVAHAKHIVRVIGTDSNRTNSELNSQLKLGRAADFSKPIIRLPERALAGNKELSRTTSLLAALLSYFF